MIYVFSKKELAELSRDKNALVNINEIKIDTALPIAQRFEDFLHAVQNPYCFLCDETPVILRFAEDGKPLDELICNHFARNMAGQ